MHRPWGRSNGQVPMVAAIVGADWGSPMKDAFDKPDSTFDLLMTPQEADTQRVGLTGLKVANATEDRDVCPGKFQLTATVSVGVTFPFTAPTESSDAVHDHAVTMSAAQFPSGETPKTKPDGLVGWTRGFSATARVAAAFSP